MNAAAIEDAIDLGDIYVRLSDDGARWLITKTVNVMSETFQCNVSLERNPSPFELMAARDYIETWLDELDLVGWASLTTDVMH